ncbi:MAG: PEGA domain-containing protein [Polyangiales bacterium]
MAGGNDPFPREEVTGLAAFENLQPVSSLHMPDEEFTDSSEPPLSASVLRARTPRKDATLPLELKPYEASNDAEHYGPEGSADHLFDDSVQHPWDDEEATRVLSHDMHGIHEFPQLKPSAGASTDLQMDWDEDEPPTQMRPNALFDAAPNAGVQQYGWDLPDETGTQVYEPTPSDEHGHGHGHDSQYARDAGPEARSHIVGGRPSPFPTRQTGQTSKLPAAVRSSRATLRHPVLASDLAQLTPGYAGALKASTHHADAGDDDDDDVLPELEDELTPALAESLSAALRSGDRRSWILLGSIAVGLLALLLIVRGLSAGASVSSAMFSTKPADAKLRVDGKEVAGASSPFFLGDLKPGVHAIVATRAGYADYQGSFELQPGESKTLPVIELVATARDVGFSVRSTPPGAAIWVDGKATDRVTPARVTGVTPGIHQLQLKAPGFADYELQMFVPEATLLQLPDAALVAREEPPTAAVVQQKPARGGRSRGDDEAELASEDDAPRTRRASSSGYPSRGYRASTSRAEPAEEPAAVAATAAASSGSSSAGKMGTLRINTRPWATVSVDGRVMGNTPQPGIQLSVGTHKVQLVNAQMGMSKSLSVTIKAGQVTTHVLNLAD